MSAHRQDMEQFWTTLGYAVAGSDRRLAYYMSKPRTLLIDLRRDPYSDYTMWDQSTLCQTWGKRYRRAGAYLGNVNHASGGEICIPRLREGLEVLLDYLVEGWSLVLLCGCMNFCECHRMVVQAELESILRVSQLDIPYIVEDTPESGMMNCLSIRQPWATIIMRAHLFRALEQRPKDVENRSWMTPWKGRLAIHAGTTFDTGLFQNKIIDPIFWQDRFGILAASVIPVHKDQYPLGAIIGIADLSAVLPPDDPALLDHPWYVPSQYGFMLKNIQPIEPIPWRGQRRLFQIPEHIIFGKEVKQDGQMAIRA